MKGRRIGITGGSGYLGSALARRLCEHNEVRIIDLASPHITDSANCSFVHCDITDRKACQAAMRGLDIIFHRAGLAGNLPSMREPQRYYEVNVLGTLNVLESCRHHEVKRFLFDSTEFVYGNCVQSPVEEDAIPEPCSIYGATKLICEHAVKYYDVTHGLPTLIFRFCRVRDATKGDVITFFVNKSMTGEDVVLFGDGSCTMDFIDIDDANTACILGAASAVRGEVVNVSSGEAVSLNEILDIVRTAVGRPAGPVIFRRIPDYPPSVEYQFGPPMFYLSIEKARRLLQWRPVTSIKTSIDQTVASIERPAKASPSRRTLT